MMNREKRRNVIKKIVRFWLKHELAIAIGLVAIFICTAITVLYVCFADRKTVTETVSSQQDYSNIFDTDESGQVVKNTRKNRTVITSTTSSGEVIEEEYKTILEYNANTKPGYMNNCIFLGDSRTVAMVSYGFVSDENVLAKVGISHTSVLSSTFMQNCGKQYTIESYLKSHKAPVIYINYGVNGMNGISEEKYEKAYKEVVEKIMDLAPESEIVLMAIWPVDDNGPYKGNVKNEWIDKYNEFLKTLAEYEGIFYLDVDSVLKGNDGQIKGEYDAGDGLHYRACAYTTILEYVIHHPVKGVSDDGEFIVKYVKPTGDFKKMMKETTALPANVQVVEPEELNQEQPQQEELITPSPTPESEKKEEPVIQLKPTPTPTPTPTSEVSQPTPTPIPSPENQPEPSPSPKQEEPQSGDQTDTGEDVTPSITPTSNADVTPTNSSSEQTVTPEGKPEGSDADTSSNTGTSDTTP